MRLFKVLFTTIIISFCVFANDTDKINEFKLTPEILWSIGKPDNIQLSPDHKKVIYTVTYFDIEKNNSSKEIYSTIIKSKATLQLTDSPENESSINWHPGGKKIGYLSNESGNKQIWEIDPDGKNKIQISNFKDGISSFKYVPKGDRIVYLKSIKLDKDVNDLYPDLPLANARIETDLMYRHWDEWHDYSYDHVFIAETENDMFVDGNDILEGETFDINGLDQIAISPNGRFIAYSSKKLRGKDFAVSTNSDIYLYDIKKGTTTNLTKGMMGYDRNPVFSPDGKYIVWNSMERDGYESDRNRIFILNLKSGVKDELTYNIDETCDSPKWSTDGKTIYYTRPEAATYQLFALDVATKQSKQITDGQHNYYGFVPGKDKIVALKASMSAPHEIYNVDISTGNDTPITSINDEIMAELKIGNVEKRWVKTTDNKDMLAWVIYPPDFSKKKKYPALLYCQGGPQGTVSQFWSLRWNFQIMAANGYVIVAPNRRGLPSFGQEWNEQISGDWGGQAMKDLLSAIDDVAKEPYIDEDRLGAVGASFGGYSVYWLAGNHNKRFKTFISHAGLFNLESWYGTTEEMFFANWDLKGSYWKENRSETWETDSPHKYAAKWDTPLLVIHGAKDFRVPEAEGMQAFQIAQLEDIPSKFLYFPTENHWILTPQNGILWQRVFFDWLDQWLK